MRKLITTLPHGEPDPVLIEKLAVANRACLGIVVLMVAANLAGWVLFALGFQIPGAWHLMKSETALLALLSALSLQPSELRFAKLARPTAPWFAIPVLALATGALVNDWSPRSFGFLHHLSIGPRIASAFMVTMSPQIAAAFALLGLAILFVRAKKGLSVHIADLLIFCLGFSVLILVSEKIFGALPYFYVPIASQISLQSLICLVLLTLVATLCRAENGVFSVLLSRGISGRIARIVCPMMLILPYIREILRARLLGSGRLPPHYATAILTSLAAVSAVMLVLFLVWRIHGMESEIHDLSLRDELTGLYNLRGFKLLAGHALRLARRSMRPFTVMFIDLDHLKEINDTLGHRAGSQFIAETAEILNKTFRETDIIGRIGGDEFAVAGQFNPMAIALTANRLREAAAERTAEAERSLPLSFSIGHVTSEEFDYETLEELLARADKAMYQEKRRKKRLSDSPVAQRRTNR